MTSDLIAPSAELGYSRLFLDFQADSEPARSYYYAISMASVADRLDDVPFDREKLVSILRSQNEKYLASPAVFETIEKLRDPRAVCIFTGQQAGLLGGPLLTLLKAISIAKSAAMYERKLNRPVLPIFWIAGDDHDFEEANHTWLINRSGEAVRVEYDSPPQYEVPTSDIIFGDRDRLDKLKSQIREICGESDFTPALYDLIDRAYTDTDSMVTGFGKMMAALTAKIGLPLFNPADADAKKLAAPFLKKVVEKQPEIHDTIHRRNEDMQTAGYHIQVEKSDDSTHLFYNHNGRKPIRRDGDRFVVDDLSFTKDELIATIDKEPEKFSPDVMTRPLMQSWLFPTASQKGGPSEIAYLAQMNQLFELFGRPTPFYRARASATIVEKRFASLMSEHQIGLGELTGDIEQVVNRVLAKSFPEDIGENFERFRRHLRTHFEDFAETSLKFDPALKSFADQTAGKIDFSLKAFEGKVFATHKKKSKEMRDRIYRLGTVLAPDRSLQERKINISYFISKYGFDVVRFIYDKIDAEEKSHQLLMLSEMNQS